MSHTRNIASAIATATAVLAALDNLRSKELYMGAYYEPEVNRFCLKGALYEHNAPKGKRIFEEYKRFEKNFTPEPNVYSWNNYPQTAAEAWGGADINVNRRLRKMGFDTDLLDSLESFGFDLRDESTEDDKESATLRKNIFKRIYKATQDAIALMELLQANPDLERSINKLKKSLTVKSRYGGESVFDLDLPVPTYN